MPLSLSFRPRFVCELLTQWQNVQLLPLTLCRHSVTLKDDRVTTLYTLWTTPSVTVARNLSVHAYFQLRMSLVPKSEVKIFQNFCRTCKAMEGSPLTCKFAIGPQAVIQRQRRFTKYGYHL